MSADSTYNGWTNYPTWAVNLWLSNDQAIDEATLKLVAVIVAETESRSEYWSLEQSHRFSATDALKEFVGELVAEEYDRPTMLGDLIGYALSEVNWDELAQHWVDTAREQVQA